MQATRSASLVVLAMASLSGCTGMATSAFSDGTPSPPPLTNGNYAITSASCAAEPLQTSGTIHYVCDCAGGADPRCAAGNAGASDSNPGTSPDKPLRTFSKAMEAFGDLRAGDTVAFCRGGVFNQNAESYWSNTNCTAAAPCIIRDYRPAWDTDGTAAMPIIFSNNYTRVFGFLNSGTQRAQRGYRLQNLSLRGSSQMAIGLGSATTDTTVCNLVIDGPHVGVQDDCKGTTSQRTTIKGSKIVNTSGMGVLMGGSGNVIADNFFDNNGRIATFDHAIYLSAHGPAAGEVVSGNEIHRNVWNGSQCQSNVIVAHGWHERLLIDNNVIISTGIGGGSCWGIALTSGGYGDTGEGFPYAVVRRNRIFGTGSVGIAIDRCTDCLVENNLVVVDGNGSGGVEAIKAPVETSGSRNITVRNNTIHFTTGATSGTFYGISSPNIGTGHVVSNNAISWSGTSREFSCLHLLASYAGVSNNSCFGGEVGYPSAQGTVIADPLYVSPGTDPTSDYTPKPGSPLVNSGDLARAASVDLIGKTRDSSPDIGAYELVP